MWDVFGGHVEPAEPPERTLQREVHEELGIAPSRWCYLDTLSAMSSDGRIVCRFYAVTDWLGTPVNKQPLEHSEIRWFRYDEIVRLNLMHPNYLHVLQEAITPSI